MNLVASAVEVSELSLGELQELCKDRLDRAFRDYSRYQRQGDLISAREKWSEYAEADDLLAMIDRLCEKVSSV